MNFLQSALSVAALAACAMAGSAEAQQCAPGSCLETDFEVYLVVGKSCEFMASTDVDFGNQTVVAGQQLESFGSLRVRCNLPIAYQITLDQGLHGTGIGDRKMMATTTGDTIAYQLYSGATGQTSCNDAGGVQWGNASAGCIYADTYQSVDQDVGVHAKLTMMGDLRAGTYSDTITATIIY